MTRDNINNVVFNLTIGRFFSSIKNGRAVYRLRLISMYKTHNARKYVRKMHLTLMINIQYNMYEIFELGSKGRREFWRERSRVDTEEKLIK